MIYEYVCDDGHVTTKRGGLGETSALCSCGLNGERRPFYLPAIIGSMKEQRYRVSEFQEASAEIAHAYSKAERKPPDYYEIGKKRAAARGAKIRRT